MAKKFTPVQILKTIGGEHRKLLLRIDQFCKKLSKSSLDQEKIFLISEIHAVISIHFRQEEEIMKQRHDVNFTKHKVDHDNLLAELKSLMETVGTTLNDNVGEALSERCHTWLTIHFEHHDRHALARDDRTP